MRSGPSLIRSWRRIVADKDPRYEVENDEIKATMREIGTLIDKAMPPGVGFALFIYQYDGEAVFYIANGERADVGTMLRAWLARESGQ